MGPTHRSVELDPFSTDTWSEGRGLICDRQSSRPEVMSTSLMKPSQAHVGGGRRVWHCQARKPRKHHDRNSNKEKGVLLI